MIDEMASSPFWGRCTLSPFTRLAEFGELHLDPRLLLDLLIRPLEDASAHRGGDRVADDSVEPVVVLRLRAHLPLLDLAPAPLGLDAVLGGEVFGE